MLRHSPIFKTGRLAGLLAILIGCLSFAGCAYSEQAAIDKADEELRTRDSVRIALSKLPPMPRIDDHFFTRSFWVPEDGKDVVLYISPGGQLSSWREGELHQLFCAIVKSELHVVTFGEEGEWHVQVLPLRKLDENRMEMETSAGWGGEGKIWRKATVKPVVTGWAKPRR